MLALSQGTTMLKMIITTLFLATITTTTNAAELHSYYPLKLKTVMNSSDSDTIKDYLFKVLNSSHQKVNGSNDVLGCGNGKGECYSQKSLGYKGARKVLFGKLHLDKDAEGYFIKDVYCRKEFRRRHTRMGPGQIPNSNILNCEHTWPQSKFTPRFNKGMQKSDLHHLYPTDSNANSIRGNYSFDDVNGSVVRDDCTASRSVRGGSFEPPAEHKGNVARAYFYFATRYQMKINSKQEAVLKRWHIEDPVDAEEIERNNLIYIVQNNRNPFIDMPELVDLISDF